jgi:hypothetical protein
MLEKFWLNCSEYQKSALASSCLILSIFIGVAIVGSDNIALNRDGLAITKTAIANQAQLEQALLLLELQQQQITEVKEKAIAINQRTKVGGRLVEDLSKVEAILPPTAVEEIEGTIERSQAVLDEEMN